MAKCAICEKTANYGNKLSITRSHISKRTSRTFEPNLRRIKADINGETKRIYEGIGDRYNPYPGLLTNTEIEDPVICDPLWLSEMLEADFISKLIRTSRIQISLFPKVIQ